MATWSQQSTLTAEHIINVVSSGTKLYFVGKATSYASRPLFSDGDIWEYDLASGVETKIIQQSAYISIGSLTSISYFKGTLYLLLKSADGGFPINTVIGDVYKWNGTTDSISLVHNVYTESAEFPLFVRDPNIFRLYNDGETMVVIAVNEDPGADYTAINICQSTTDGSNFSSGSMAFNPHDPVGAGTKYTYAAEFFPGSIYEILYDPDAATYKAVKFSGGSFAVHQAALPGSSGSLLYTDPGESIHWNTFNSNSYYFNLAMSSSAQGTPEISAIIQINMPYSVGIETNFGDHDVYITSDGNWTLLDAASLDVDPTQAWIVRADNADVFIIFRSGATSNSEVWKRSEGIPFPAAESRIWMYKTENHGQSWTSRGVVT